MKFEWDENKRRINLKKYGTDIERLKNMKDEDIDYSDIPPTTYEMWEKGVLRRGFKVIPKENQENLPIDRDIIEYFKSLGFNYPAKINEILRAYMQAQQTK